MVKIFTEFTILSCNSATKMHRNVLYNDKIGKVCQIITIRVDLLQVLVIFIFWRLHKK